MKEKVKKGLAYLLSSVLFVSTFATMLPQMALTVNAEGNEKAIQLVLGGVANNIEGAQKSNVYFGTYKQTSDGNGGFNIDPIKWRVLSNSAGKLFLLSDKLLDVEQFHTEYDSVIWKGSTIRSWLNGYDGYSSDNFIDTAFDNAEQLALLKNYDNSDNNNGDKIFLLSTSEVTSKAYGFSDNYSATETRQSANTAYVAAGGKTGNEEYTNNEDENDYWWLRSPGFNPKCAAEVDCLGVVKDSGVVDHHYCVRPALNINLKSVLFTSAATGGKKSGAAGADALTAVADYSGNEWKLTIEDTNRTDNFRAERIDYNAVSAGNTVSIKYSGAQTGNKEFVSAILTDDNDNILYYGNIAKCTDSSGEASINIKSGTPDGCKLYVFNEQCNGDKKTDYSSKLLDLTAPKTKPVPKNINLVTNGEADYIEGAQKSNVYFGTYKQTSDGNGGFNIDPIKWRVLSNSDGKLFLLSDKNLDVVQYHIYQENVTWEGSSIRSWLNGYDISKITQEDEYKDYNKDNFIGTAFNNAEESALLEVDVLNEKNPEYDTPWGNNTKDKVYLLSIGEAVNATYGFTIDYNLTDTRKSANTAYVADGGKNGVSGMYPEGTNDYWWLRSPGNWGHNAAFVGGSGYVSRTGYNVTRSDIAVRPALNINLESLIFTSAAEGGKSSDVLTGNSLQSIQTLDDTSNVVWTFTLRDTSRNKLSVSRLGSGDVANGGTVRFAYDNATRGDDEYISTILFDENDEMISYGKAVKLTKDSDDSGESYVTLPSNLIDGKTYKLRFISEKCSEDSPTDLASDFDSSRDISFTVGTGTPSAADFDLQFSLGNSITSAADIMYNGSEWKVNANIPEGVTGMGKVTVIYIDSEGNESEDAPKDVGEYKIKLVIAEGTNYSAKVLTDENWKFTVNPADPKTSDFVFTAPADLNFDSKGKQATVTKKDDIDGITFKTEYYDSKGNKFDDGKYPVEPGKYFVKVIVSQDGNFNAGMLESTEWSFEIKTVDYTVTLNTDGGNIKSNNVTGYTYQTGATLPTASDIEKKGYTFKGWYVNADFTGNPVTEITSTEYEDKTYYAKWEANKYTVIFDANAEGKEQNTMPNQDRIYDDGKELPKIGYIYEGRTFNGWTTNKDGFGTHYSDKEIANLSDIDGAIVTLYAQWTIDTFTVVWKNYDGEELKTAQVPYGTTAYYNGDAPVKPDTAEFSYKFDKWSPEEGEITKATTYIATYTETRKSYTVKFVNEDGTELQSSELEYGSMPSYEKTPDKADNGNKTYHFAGWSPSIVSVTGEAIYQATYSEEEIVYIVTFDPNGGTVNPSEDITNEQFKLTMLPEPNLEGYKFLGWFTAVENGAEITTDTVFTADTTVYALWEEITEPEEPEEEELEEPETPPNYLDELFLKLNIAAELGGKQEVYWNVGDSLPYDVLHFLELHEDITLIFDYTYEDVDYSVTLGGKGFEADPKVPWAGPLYLYSVYKGKIIAKED